MSESSARSVDAAFTGWGWGQGGPPSASCLGVAKDNRAECEFALKEGMDTKWVLFRGSVYCCWLDLLVHSHPG